MNNPLIYALDFDGVICDSAVETAMTGWKAANKLWGDMPEVAPEVVINQFRQVRPNIETGYEAILAMRLLHLGESTEAIYDNYNNKIQGLLDGAKVSIDDLKQLFGETRDIWIAKDLNSWIAMNPLFPGVADRLHTLGQACDWYVITTKQERFVKQILKANGIELPDERIYGLDRDMSKNEVLQILIKSHPESLIYFIEDRLPTLLKVLKDEKLAGVKLVFALWGYNTEEDKRLAKQQPFVSQRLEDFLACPLAG